MHLITIAIDEFDNRLEVNLILSYIYQTMLSDMFKHLRTFLNHPVYFNGQFRVTANLLFSLLVQHLNLSQ